MEARDRTLKIIVLALFLIGFGTPLLADQDIEVLNAGIVETTNDVKVYYFPQGHTIILKDTGRDESCSRMNIFGNQYEKDSFDSRGFLFLGIDVSYMPGDYSILVTDCDGLKERNIKIKVLPGEFEKTRISRYTTPPTQRTDRQKRVIGSAFNDSELIRDLTLGQTYVRPLEVIDIIDPFGFIYGNNPLRSHGGVDLKVPVGTAVKAINRGRVELVAVKFRQEGNMLILNHGLGVFSVYMHLSKFNVKKGQVVEAGQVIAWSGRTGAGVREPHLHFNIRIHNSYVDPLKFIEEVNRFRK